MIYLIFVEGFFKISVFLIEIFRFCEFLKLGGIVDMLYMIDFKRVWVQFSCYFDNLEGVCYKMVMRMLLDKRFVGYCNIWVLYKCYEFFYIIELFFLK